MNELLLELFSEEIPARMQQNAANQLAKDLETKFNENSISFTKIFSYSTPRRVAVIVEGLPEKTEAKNLIRKGPKIDARKEAIDGFLKATGAQLQDLEIKDGFYYFSKFEEEKPVRNLLNNIITQILTSFTWPKSMRLSESRVRWVRPLRNILCVFSNEIIPVKFNNLIANNYTYGHRFMANHKIEISSHKDYREKLANAFVIISPQERKNIILKQIESLNLVKQNNLDQELLDEIVGLVEYPNSLSGKIEEKFLKLPKEVLITSMKNHQRYFHVENDKGELLPYFITVANIKNEHDELIIKGNEKVLKARLSDAEFFFNLDQNLPISESLAKLSKLIFHSKLGNMFDKTNRIIELSGYINNNLYNAEDVKQAALLCKTDLVSEMVGEFPELQGIMGKYYAHLAGIDLKIAEAIAEHYRPFENQDKGDISSLAAIISIADKIDTIVGLWFVGEKPTSSKDPFGLRRSALGIIKLIRFHNFDISIKALIKQSVAAYSFIENQSVIQEIEDFFHDRFKYLLKAENYRHDFINAVMDYHGDKIAYCAIKIDELTKFSDDKDTFLMLKRINNLVGETNIDEQADTAIMQTIELNLYKAILEATATFESLKKLVPLANEFFDNIMVNDKDDKLKNNRIAILRKLHKLGSKIANFNLVEI